jgi:two-component system, OmpR family, response regulator
MTDTSLEKKVVLVAEDETDIREALVTALETLGGYTVIACADGQTALDRIEADKPDHIILDIHMPNMNGDNVLEKLRDNPWLVDVPVTILTAQSDMAAVANSIAVGGTKTAYFIKSDLSLAKLVDHVAMTLR